MLKECAFCGRKFEAYTKRQNYCSRYCVMQAGNELTAHKKGRDYYRKICPECGKVFGTLDAEKVYCGTMCKIRVEMKKI